MAQNKRIIFKTPEGVEIPSLGKFMLHLHDIGSKITKWTLDHQHMQRKNQGTITLDGREYEFTTIYVGKKQIEPSQNLAAETDGKLKESTYTTKYELTPTHQVELTFSSKNTLLHTKSISLS